MTTPAERQRSAFGIAITVELPRLRRYARRLAGADADDLVQDTVLMALCKSHLFLEGDLRAWLFTIMHNSYVTGVRLSARRATVGLDENIACDSTAEAHVFARDVIGEIRRLLPERRRVIERLALGASYAEIARRERLPIGTVRSRIARGRNKLRQFAGITP